MIDQQRDLPWARVALGALVVIWLLAVSQLMIVDVWDETEAIDLIDRHDAVDLVVSNFRQAEAGGVVLFRPIPFMLATVVVKSCDAEIAWRVLRWFGALLVLASLVLFLGLLGEVGGRDPIRDVLVTVVLLFSGSAMITSGWFATLFDSSTLVLVSAGLFVLARGHWKGAGILLSLAFFCKETAVLVFPALVTLAWIGAIDRRNALKAGTVAFFSFSVYVALRLLIVPLGSVNDVHPVSVAGIISAGLRLPETLWWQVADLPVRWLGWIVFVASIAVLRSWRSAAGVLGIVLGAALIYGGQIHIGATPLLAPDAFIGRLYLVPAALVAVILAAGRRRAALVLVLLPVLWGAAQTWDRHRRVQQAYSDLYELAQPGWEEPLKIDSPSYSQRTVHDRRRGLILGAFPEADWHFDLDGTLQDRSGQ